MPEDFKPEKLVAELKKIHAKKKRNRRGSGYLFQKTKDGNWHLKYYRPNPEQTQPKQNGGGGKNKQVLAASTSVLGGRSHA
jgi:hypothetical protein